MQITRGIIWDQKQRIGNPIHQTSYMGCYQPGLVDFFLDRYTVPGDYVYDPYAGRGTVPTQAALRGRSGCWDEANPYGRCLIRGKTDLLIFTPGQIAQGWENPDRDALPLFRTTDWLKLGLGNFFHGTTIKQIREIQAIYQPTMLRDIVNLLMCITMTGHSPGYLSIRTMPPNMQIPSERQFLLNQGAEPPEKNVLQLLKARLNRLVTGLPGRSGASMWEGIPPQAKLILTSPPFLNLLDYNKINWIRNLYLAPAGYGKCPELFNTPTLSEWCETMKTQLIRCREHLHPEGRICVEAGSIRKDKVNLIDAVLAIAGSAGLEVEELFIQEADHSRTSRCWGVGKSQGTKTQQVLVLKALR